MWNCATEAFIRVLKPTIGYTESHPFIYLKRNNAKEGYRPIAILQVVHKFKVDFLLAFVCFRSSDLLDSIYWCLFIYFNVSGKLLLLKLERKGSVICFYSAFHMW
jgi:hypothetical protein